jgi:oxygen-dependent protoporphyrinogen oxidase
MIVIIGAGISGLTLAYELEKAHKPYMLIESSSRTGGYIHSVQMDAYTLEVGPNSVLIDSAFKEFLDELNLSSEIEQAAAINKNRFVYKNNRIQKIPSNLFSLLFSSFFSFNTKISILKEITNKTKTVENESVHDFFTRRFSKSFTNYTIDPFATGIYAGDIKQLLIQETFPSLVAYEAEFGSIIKGVFKKGFGSRRKTASIKGGLQTITHTIAQKLSSIKYNTQVVAVKPTHSGIEVTIQSETNINKTIVASDVVFCCPTFKAAIILADAFPGVSDKLMKVNYAPIKAVFTAFKRKDISHPMDGFGCLYPSVESSFLAGCIWNSSIFKNRCPDDEVLMTSFIGGINHPEYTKLSDEEILVRAVAQLKKDLIIDGEPTFIHIAGWEKAIPQYDLNLKNVRNDLKDLTTQHIFFRSNWTKSISLGECVQNARKLAVELLK